MKNNKASSPDEILAEALETGWLALLEYIHSLLLKILNNYKLKENSNKTNHSYKGFRIWAP